MKVTQKIFSFLVLAAAVLTGCERDYDAPPLNEPVYEGPSANITIADLKENCKNATQETPIEITNDWVLKAYVTGNDESGNIYKQVIVQDETGAMPIQVDENNVSNFYRRGQEVFVNLKGMCVSVYGDEQQLGWLDGGTTYRLPFTEFQARVQKNGWPYVDNVKPEVITDMSTVNLDVTKMTYRLVQMEGVHFENGGKNTFAKVETKEYGEENLKDAHGNVIMVRTSSYASFAAETLPVGTGTVVGILGRFKGTWQLMIPSRSDVFGFDGVEPGEGDDGNEGGETVLFSETFKAPDKISVDGKDRWASSITEWWDASPSNTFDNPSSMFSGDLDLLSPRTQSGDGNIWFYGGDYSLSIENIDLKGAAKVSLIYKMGVNVYQPEDKQNINTLSVKCNNTDLPVPDKELTGTKNPYVVEEIRIDDIAVSGTATLTFSCVGATNVKGIRLYDVKLIAPGSGEGDGEVIKPEPTK